MAIRNTVMLLSLLLTAAACSDSSSDADGGDNSVDGSPAEAASGDADATSNGACDNPADRKLLGDFGDDLEATAFIGCESAVCTTMNLMLPAIDKDGLMECAENDAPVLSQLSAGCRECYVGIALCIPEKCVTILGGENACSSFPPDNFEACEDGLPDPSDTCAECQGRLCQPDFIACSGLDAELP
jgi:hypothetical protein